MNHDTASVLISTFQLAIIDFTKKIESDPTLSATDIKSANIVAAMAALNAFNLEQVVKQGVDYYEKNRMKVDRLLREASEFAASLQAEGFGIAALPLPAA